MPEGYAVEATDEAVKALTEIERDQLLKRLQRESGGQSMRKHIDPEDRQSNIGDALSRFDNLLERLNSALDEHEKVRYTMEAQLNPVLREEQPPPVGKISDATPSLHGGSTIQSTIMQLCDRLEMDIDRLHREMSYEVSLRGRVDL